MILTSEVASKVSANKNEGVSISQVPESMKNAVIAIEDHRFYQHMVLILSVSLGRLFVI